VSPATATAIQIETDSIDHDPRQMLHDIQGVFTGTPGHDLSYLYYTDGHSSFGFPSGAAGWAGTMKHPKYYLIRHDTENFANPRIIKKIRDAFGKVSGVAEFGPGSTFTRKTRNVISGIPSIKRIHFIDYSASILYLSFQAAAQERNKGIEIEVHQSDFYQAGCFHKSQAQGDMGYFYLGSTATNGADSIDQLTRRLINLTDNIRAFNPHNRNVIAISYDTLEPTKSIDAYNHSYYLDMVLWPYRELPDRLDQMCPDNGVQGNYDPHRFECQRELNIDKRLIRHIVMIEGGQMSFSLPDKDCKGRRHFVLSEAFQNRDAQNLLKPRADDFAMAAEGAGMKRLSLAGNVDTGMVVDIYEIQ
jgi:hypothetical protein